MKNLIFSGFLLAASALANESTTLIYEGQNSPETVELSSILYRDEVIERPVTRTCSRMEFRGYRRVCGPRGPFPGPRGPFPRPMPRPVPGGFCELVPVYVRIFYPCTVIEREVVRVRDADVSATVQANFKDLTGGMPLHEQLEFKLKGVDLTLKAVGSPGVLTSVQRRGDSTRDGDRINIQSIAVFSFRKASELSQSFADGVSRLKLKGGVLSFVMKDSAATLPIRFHLKLVRDRSVGSDSVLLNQALDRSFFTATALGDGQTLFSTTLESLGLPQLSRGKYRVQLSSEVDFPGEEILNRAAIPGGLRDQAALRIKIR